MSVNHLLVAMLLITPNGGGTQLKLNQGSFRVRAPEENYKGRGDEKIISAVAGVVQSFDSEVSGGGAP